MIRLENISKIYPKEDGILKVLENINLNIKKDELVSIIGPSGCGKTTLLKIIGGILKPTTGQILINNQKVENILHEKIIGFVFQNPLLMRWRTVKENINLYLEIKSKNVKNYITKLLNVMSLKDFENSYPHQLSGGMQAKVAIARALVAKPSILLMDEPFGTLDEITRERLNLELTNLWQEHKTNLSNIIFVTHNINEAIFLSDKIIVLSKRPARIKEVIITNLKMPREFEVEDNKKFILLRKKIIKLID